MQMNIRPRVEQQLRRHPAASCTLRELASTGALASAEWLHLSSLGERTVDAVVRFDPGQDIEPGELVVHGPGPLQWSVLTAAGRSGACGVVIPQTWPPGEAHMIRALGAAQRIAVFAIEPDSDWDAFQARLAGDHRRIMRSTSADAGWAQPIGAAELRNLLERGPRDRRRQELVEPGSRVLAFAVATGTSVPGELADTIARALWLALLDPDVPHDAEGTLIDTTAYVVLRRNRPEPELRRIAEHLRRLLAVTLDHPVLAAIGSAIKVTADVPASCREANRVLALSSRRPTPSAATLGDVRHLALLEAAVAAFQAHPQLMSQRLAMLRRSDAARNTSYVPVLRAFLDQFGDINTAADRLGMHHNTFRYRLKRAVEVAGMDLDDPAERLALQVELAADS